MHAWRTQRRETPSNQRARALFLAGSLERLDEPARLQARHIELDVDQLSVPLADARLLRIEHLDVFKHRPLQFGEERVGDLGFIDAEVRRPLKRAAAARNPRGYSIEVDAILIKKQSDRRGRRTGSLGKVCKTGPRCA
jgi:hypothetical protein